MISFARTCEAIASTPSKNAKVEILAAYLRSLSEPDLEASARFFTGSAFAQRDERRLSVGGSTIVAAAKSVWGISEAELGAAYREHGDLGAALAACYRPAIDVGLFSQTLTPASLHALFEEMAAATGRASGKRRLHLCRQILLACSDPLEVKYAVKIMTGDLRIGLRTGLVIDAIAAAFEATPGEVRRANMAAGDIGSVALAARLGELHGVTIALGAPIGFMLASPIAFGGPYGALAGAQWLIEDKYDGIRAQAHKQGDVVRLFSRTLNDVSRSYPEVVDALARVPGNFILDGELVAQRDGAVLPFRYLQARLQRKDVTGELLSDVPIGYMIFDVLALGERYLLDEPLSERRAVLAQIGITGAQLSVGPARTLGQGEPAAELHAAFEDARARGHEGLVLKRADSPYYPGRRGKWWLKLKRELATLDVVVVAVEWGHGKRAKVLSDYTFAVRGSSGELLTIGKAYSGLTDAEIAQLTPWFLAHRLPAGAQRERARAHEIPVEPDVVLEVAFDIIQKSELHESGFALRFPRIVRIREDKPASEIDTVESVEAIYRAMVDREGIAK